CARRRRALARRGPRRRAGGAAPLWRRCRGGGVRADLRGGDRCSRRRGGGRVVDASTPGVSFVIPVYNGARTLGSALASVLAQASGRACEVIAVDDGSDDGSLRILEPHVRAGRVRLLRGEGRGAAAALNQGIRAARHEIVCQVDPDLALAP